mmetsp:Transcript_6205/g.9355  ORF Transcript_6205/g.9355 Transcript_6205/m.9355 type:complete len:325 (-) Transcript_6205:87-1061(-)
MGKKVPNTVLLDHSTVKPTLLSYIVVWSGLGWFITVPCVIAAFPFLWTHFKPLVCAVGGSMLLSAIYTVDRSSQPEWGFALGRWIMKNCCAYFSFKIEFEDVEAVQKAGPALFAIEPHGVLPISIYWGSLNILSRHKFLCCLSSSMLIMPMMKHILTWTGAISADKATMVKYIRQGFSLNICPGGVQEVAYLGNPKECVLFLRKRFGIIKMAMEEGIPLIPSMTFGLHKAYDFWVPSSDFAVRLGRRIGFLPMIFFGLGGVPFAQAKPCPLSVVVGKPIMLPHKSTPTTEEIAKYHAIFIDEMVRLYEENKVAHGMADITLRIE